MATTTSSSSKSSRESAVKYHTLSSPRASIKATVAVFAVAVGAVVMAFTVFHR